MHGLTKRLISSERFIFIVLSVFVILRFPSLFEPYWYGDEGIYQIIGASLNQGRELYSGIWDNKPPLFFLLYALFQGNQFVARLASLAVGLLTIVIFFSLGKRLLGHIPAFISTLVFAISYGSPYLEGNIANTENFMLLPTVLGMYVTYRFLKRDLKHSDVLILFAIGILLGLSFSMKVVGIFEYGAVCVLLFLYRKTIVESLRKVSIVTLGFITPFLLFTIYYTLQGLLVPYMQSVLFVNISYVGHGNYFLIPQGLLFFKVILLTISIASIYLFRQKLSQNLSFLLVWLGFALFSSFFSQRSYTHYILLSLPSMVLLGGYLFSHLRKYRIHLIAYLFLLVFLIIYFKPYPVAKTVSYYGNFLTYLAGFQDTVSYQSFFDSRVPRDYQIASYLDMKLKPYEEVFIWSNSAQIYVLSETLPIGRYSVAYHIISNDAYGETQHALNTKKPRFIVITQDEPFQGLSLHDYTYRMSLNNTRIYERTF